MTTFENVYECRERAREAPFPRFRPGRAIGGGPPEANMPDQDTRVGPSRRSPVSARGHLHRGEGRRGPVVHHDQPGEIRADRYVPLEEEHRYFLRESRTCWPAADKLLAHTKAMLAEMAQRQAGSTVSEDTVAAEDT